MYKRYAREYDAEDEPSAKRGRGEMGAKFTPTAEEVLGDGYKRDFYDEFNDNEERQETKAAAREPLLNREEELRNKIDSDGPGRRVMQQGVVVTTVQQDMKEALKRLRQNPADFIVPDSLAPGQDPLFKCIPGDVLMERCLNDAQINSTHLGMYGSRQVFCAMNGLSRYEPVRFAGIFAQPSRDVGASGDDALTMEVRGSTTIVLNGPSPIEHGQDVICDEVPFTRTGADGRPESVVHIKGVSPKKLHPAIYGLRCSDMTRVLADARAIVDKCCDKHQNDSAAAWDEMMACFKEQESMHGRLQCLRNYAAYYFYFRHKRAHNDQVAEIEKIMRRDIAQNDAVNEHFAAFGPVAGTSDAVLFRKAVDANDKGAIAEVLFRRLEAAVQIFKDGIRRRTIGKCIKGGQPGAAIDVVQGTSSLL